MTTTAPAAPGQTVIYTGSLVEFRGPAVFVGVCDVDGDCRECQDRFDQWEFYGAPGDAPIRYRLRLNSSCELRCVRAESFAAVVPDATAAQL